MKHLGILLATGLTLVIVMVVAIFSFFSGGTPSPAANLLPTTAPQPAVVIPQAPNVAEIQATLAEREATYQAQIDQLNQALQERQRAYQAQIQELSGQITAGQNQLNQLKAQEQNQLAQAAQLETTRAERLATYQGQLEQVQNEYNARYSQVQTQLSEIQNKLASARAELGQ